MHTIRLTPIASIALAACAAHAPEQQRAELAGSTCPTTTLATPSPDRQTIRSFDQDADRIYWEEGAIAPFATPHDVRAVPKSGGDPVTLAAGELAVRGLTVRDGFLYYSRASGTGREIVRMPTDGSAPPAVLVTVTDHPLLGFSLNSTHVYYELSLATDVKDTYRVPRDGGDPEFVVETPGARSETYMVFVDDDSLYWVHADAYPDGLAVHARDLATGEDRVVVSLGRGGYLPFLYGDYAATATTLYWGSGEQLLAVDKAGGAPTAVFGGDPETTIVSSVVTNGSVLVWAAMRRDVHWECDDDGCGWVEDDLPDGFFATQLDGTTARLYDATCVAGFGAPGAGDTAWVADATRVFWQGARALKTAPL